MKKIVLALFVLSATMVFGQENDWKKEKPLDNGSHLLFTAGGGDIVTDGSLLGLDWGNTFMIYKFNSIDLALGLETSWIDASYNSSELTSEDNVHTFLLSTAIGPNATYKIMDKLSAKMHFKFRPTGMLIFDDALSSNDDGYGGDWGIGTTNSFGLSVRYDVFTLGFEFISGMLTTTRYVDDILGNEQEIKTDRKLNYSRLFIGFRF